MFFLSSNHGDYSYVLTKLKSWIVSGRSYGNLTPIVGPSPQCSSGP